MKKAFTIALSLLTVGMVSSCREVKDTDIPYNNAEYGFSLSYPEEWADHCTISEGNYLVVRLPDGRFAESLSVHFYCGEPKERTSTSDLLLGVRVYPYFSDYLLFSQQIETTVSNREYVSGTNAIYQLTTISDAELEKNPDSYEEEYRSLYRDLDAVLASFEFSKTKLSLETYQAESTTSANGVTVDLPMTDRVVFSAADNEEGALVIYYHPEEERNPIILARLVVDEAGVLTQSHFGNMQALPEEEQLFIQAWSNAIRND